MLLKVGGRYSRQIHRPWASRHKFQSRSVSMAGTFALGSIPPLSVWEGETLNLKVTSKLGAGVTYSLRATPAPAGQMSIDAKSGAFTYAPKSSDREELAVTISASNGGKAETQTVAITPHPRLPAEFRIIRHE